MKGGYVEVDVNARIPHIGASISKADFAVIMMCILVLCDSMKPERVVVAGRDISVGVGSCSTANSVSALLVAFVLANSYEFSSLMSSKPSAIMTFAFPYKRVSEAISRELDRSRTNSHRFSLSRLRA